MDGIVNGLNPAQRAAVTSHAAVLQVLAPPGSGKTKTLTARVAYLIANDGLDPRNIVVCTFTIKAAKEMKDRIEGFLGKAIASRLILGTYHSVARRFLAIHGHLIGLPDRFGIADASDSKAMISRLIKSMRLTINPAKARSRISTLKANGTSPEQYSILSHGNKGAPDSEDIIIVYSAYEEELKLSNLLDYDDLLVRCEELLRRFPACVSHIEAVLVDEFQDTNHVQFELMCRFAQQNNCISTVGDPDQSIYGWRSADITNLSKMRERFPETHVVNLEENYRSSGMILLTAQDIIDQDQGRPQKSLVPTHCLGVAPILRRLHSADIEARWTIGEIKRTVALSAGLLGYNDYAILLRSAFLSRLIESQLGKEGIPYRMVGGHRFFDRVEVKLVLDYLRVIDSPDHAEALSRVLNVPPRRIGETTLSALMNEASQTKVSLWSLVKSAARGGARHKAKITPQAQRGIDAFYNIVATAQTKLNETSTESLVDFIQWLLRKLDLKTYISEKYPEEGDTRWANVQELTAQASELVGLARQEAPVTGASKMADESTDFEESDNTPLTGSVRVEQLSLFLGNVALATDKQEAAEAEGSLGHVTISTIHAAKGLEFPVVFVPAVYEGSIPHSRSENTDEERRLLYVAMTRAQVLLYLSCAREDSGGNPTTLSQFLSSQTLAPRFLHKGPSFTGPQIQEAAAVLRRSCPSDADISAARLNTAQKEDDQWSGGETEEGGTWTSDSFDSYGYSERPLKRQCSDWRRGAAATNGFAKSSSIMVATSMSSSEGFSISAVNYGSSFVTASTVAQLEVSHEQKPAKRRPALGTETRNGVGERPSKPPPTGQRDITAFFGKASLVVTKSTKNLDPLPAKALTPLRDATTPHTDAWNETAQVEGTCPAPHSSDISRTPGFAPQRKTLGVRRTMNGWPPPSRNT